MTRKVSVVIEKDEAVLRILLDRPGRKNALDVDAIAQVVGSLESAATDETLRAVYIGSTGDDFCSGADWVAANQGEQKPRTGSIQRRVPLQAHRLVELLTAIQLPVVCGVRGWASGLGFQIALAADFAVAAEDACFWEPFLDRGFSPDSGATWLLPRLVGLSRAKELLLLGRKLTGLEAAEWGLILKAVPAADLDVHVGELVDKLASGPTVAIGLTKRSLHRNLTSNLVEAMEVESVALELASRTIDFREGLAAFAERRQPEFGGR